MGIVVFASVASAMRAGFQVYDRTENGFLVRRRNANGLFEMAFAKEGV